MRGESRRETEIMARQNKWVRKKFLELRAFADSMYHGCVFCGSEDWEFAHIRPTALKGRGRGRKERYHDIVTHFDCYRPMCLDCHKSYDDGEDGPTYDPYHLERSK